MKLVNFCLLVIICFILNAIGWVELKDRPKCEPKTGLRHACTNNGLRAEGDIGIVKTLICENLETSQFDWMAIYFEGEAVFEFINKTDIAAFGNWVRGCLKKGEICCNRTKPIQIEACLNVWEEKLELTIGNEAKKINLSEQEALYINSLVSRNK